MIAMLRRENGLALPMVLYVLVVVFVIAVLLGSVVVTHMAFTAHSESALSARYICEGGVKVGLYKAIDYLNTGNNLDNPELYSPSDESAAVLIEGATYNLTCRYLGDPDSTTDPERYEIVATTNFRGTPGRAEAWIVFNSALLPNVPPPTLTQLIQSANFNKAKNCYSTNVNPKNKEWSIKNDPSKGRDYGAPPGNVTDPDAAVTGHNYILFEDQLGPEFKLTYNLEFTKASGYGGAGIIYGANTEHKANDFSGYCAKFNNNNGNFGVNKFVRQRADDSLTQPVELQFYSTNPHDMDQTTRKGWGDMMQANGLNMGSLTNLTADSQRTDPLGNPVGRSNITFDDLAAVMNAYYNNLAANNQKLPDGRDVPDEIEGRPGERFDPRTTLSEYSITIDVQEEDVAVQYGKIHWQTSGGKTVLTYGKNGNMPAIASWEASGSPVTETRQRQIVSIDGCPVLNFMDFSDTYTPDPINGTVSGKTKTLADYPSLIYNSPNAKIHIGENGYVRTGLRAVNVNPLIMKFYNVRSLSSNHVIREDYVIRWRK